MNLTGDWAEIVDHLNSATKGPPMPSPKNEPVLIVEAVKAIILCAVAFGLDWTGDQVAAVMLVVFSISAVFTRSKVTPV